MDRCYVAGSASGVLRGSRGSKLPELAHHCRGSMPTIIITTWLSTNIVNQKATELMNP